MFKRITGVFVAMIALLGVVYTGYSGWYSYRLFMGEALTNHKTCVEGVPVASAASIDLSVKRFHWVWAPVPAPVKLRNIPGADVVTRRLPRQPKADQVIIQFADGSKYPDRKAYAESIGGKMGRSLGRVDAYVVTFESGQAPAIFPPSPIVVNIERDNFLGVSGTDDEFSPEQWALPYLSIDSVWLNLPEDAQEITVAVIDSGVCLDHPDMEDRYVFGWDYIEEDNKPQDEMGHGCGVAGVIAAIGGNKIGIAGVAPVAKVMPLRVLDKQGIGTQSNIAAAIIFAADRRVNIINLSLSGPNPSQVMEDAINYALAKGVTVIAAAGNNGSEGAWYPAAYENVIAVGSIDPTAERSNFSNYGTNVDIFAPGRDIYTTSHTNDYTTMTGTSFAAPLVSGLTALEFAINGVELTETGEAVRPSTLVATCE